MKLERRAATRYNFGAIAEVIDLDEPDELVSLTRDLSSSGCFVVTTTPFPKGNAGSSAHHALWRRGYGDRECDLQRDAGRDGHRVSHTSIPATELLLERWLAEESSL